MYSVWKTARRTPIFKREDETDCGSYRPVFPLKVPSKIMESEVNDDLIQNILKINNLVSERQWAYRAGYLTELLLIHLTETWRRALDSGKIVVVVFVEFQKAFDSVSNDILETKLIRYFGITGLMLEWLRDYLNGRQQFTVLNGTKSDLATVSTGIPQGSVLGPSLVTLFTNDLPSSVVSDLLYMYADDTTIFCIGETADTAITQLNKVLDEIHIWCLNNRLTPHLRKSEVMLISKGTLIGHIAPARLWNSILKWVKNTRLLGLTVDERLNWVQHTLELKKSFVSKLDLLKRSRFLPRDVLRDFYFKVILPSIKYGLVL